MGQARIKKLRQQAEAEKKKTEPPAKAQAASQVQPTEPSITINTDGISDDEKKTDKFKSAYRDMMNQLTAPGFIPALCAHEAAHAFYFTLAGMKEFEPLPAHIKFDPAINDYTGHLAAIQVLDLPPWTQGNFHEWFYKIAKAHGCWRYDCA